MIDLQKLLANSKKDIATNPDERVLIIDGLNTWLRVVSSIAVVNENGVNVGGIVGFLRSIGSNIRDFKPSRCIIVFDGKGGSQRRRKLFPDYKANRTGKFKPKQVEGCELNDDDLKASMRWQLQRVMMYLDKLPVQIVCMDHIEADDAIAYICKQYFEEHSNKIRIVSTDRDFLQLVSKQIEVYSPVKKVTYSPTTIQTELELHPDNYLLYRMVTGDTSDNIPGISGLGLKTIIKYFPEITKQKVEREYLFDVASKGLLEKKPKAVYKTLLENKEQLEINYNLMQLSETDISGHSKISITDIVKQNTKRTNKAEFKQLLIEDYLTGAFKDPDNWLYSTFSTLNVWATH